MAIENSSFLNWQVALGKTVGNAHAVLTSLSDNREAEQNAEFRWPMAIENSIF